MIQCALLVRLDRLFFFLLLVWGSDAWPNDWFFFWYIYIQVREGRMPGENVEVENPSANISEVMLIVQVYVWLT